MEPVSASIAIIGMGASVAQGFMAMESGKAEQAQARFQAEDARIQGLEKDRARIDDYYSTISSIDALRNGRNMSLDSPTGIAIEKSLRDETLRNRLIEKGNTRRDRGQLLMQGKLARQAGIARAIGSFGEAVPSLWSQAQKQFPSSFGGL